MTKDSMHDHGGKRARCNAQAVLVATFFPAVAPVAFLLPSGAMGAVREQPSAAHAYAETIGDQPDSSDYRVAAVYDGEYFCYQGRTKLPLEVLSGSTGGAPQRAIFSFGGPGQNASAPAGSFLMQGRIDVEGGILDMVPLSWVKQPDGYVMVGLAGRSDDGGDTFTGTITGGYQCSAFYLLRSR